MGNVTILLREWQLGSKDAEYELFLITMPHLRRLAGFLLRGERRIHSLQATELVNHIYCRLVAAKDRDWESRRQFFAIAARAMRCHLIDIIRSRPDAELVPLQSWDGVSRTLGPSRELALTLERLLEVLGRDHPDWCSMIELKYFMGFTEEEAAEALHLPLRTLQRTLHRAKRWLLQRMQPGAAIKDS
jgi:RNA polymerase sigma factor (TIGR02999 family)